MGKISVGCLLAFSCHQIVGVMIQNLFLNLGANFRMIPVSSFHLMRVFTLTGS